ncbi:MAG: hypothetical protein ABI564_16475 [Ideonella sp.]
MRLHSHCADLRGSPFAAALTLGLLLVAGSVYAQAPVSPATGMPGAGEATRQEYADLDWTGRPLSPQTLRKEAGAARAEGRRSCAQNGSPPDRKTCLQTVEADYQSMLSRLKMRTASRR